MRRFSAIEPGAKPPSRSRTAEFRDRTYYHGHDPRSPARPAAGARGVQRIEKDPDILVDLMAVMTDFEGEVIVKRLEAEGIPAWVFSASGRTLSAMVSVTNPIRVQVRRKDLELAREALKRIREESVDLDWDEIDLGDPETAATGPVGIDRALGRLAILVLVLLGILLVAAVIRGGGP